jgi:hypothetical protein
LLAWVFAGLALSAGELYDWASRRSAERGAWRRWLARWDTPVVAGVLVLVALAFVGSATRENPNPNDDWLAYLPFARKLLQTGSFIEPFSLRRMASYGGQSLLQAVTLIAADDAQVHLFDQGICRVMLTALVLGFSRESRHGSRLVVVLLAVAVLMLPEVRINSSSSASGAVGFVAVFRTMVLLERRRARDWRAAVLLGLVFAAVCTLRQNYQVCAALMWAALLLPGADCDWRERRRYALRVAIAVAACLLPWAVLAFRSNHSFLFPLFHGNYDPSYAGLTPEGSTWQTRFKLLVTIALAGEPIRLLPVLLLIAPAAARGCHRRALFGLWLGAIVALVALPLSIPEADNLSIQRYSFAFLVALMVATALAASDEVRAAIDAKTDSAVAILAAVVLAVQVHGTHQPLEKNLQRIIDRLAAADRSPPPLAVTEPDVRKLQAAVPPGERLLVMIERPYLLDFARNRILLLDQPGAVSPAPHYRPADGPDKLADYMLAQGIRYFAFVYPSKAETLYSRSSWTRLKTGHARVWRLAADVYLASFDAVDGLAKTRARLHDDGRMAVVDLATRVAATP